MKERAREINKGRKKRRKKKKGKNWLRHEII